MQSNAARIAVAVVAVLAIAALVVLLGGDDSDEETVATDTTTQQEQTTDPGEGGGSGGAEEQATTRPEPEPVPTIVVEGGEPKGGVADLDFKKGERVEFVVRSDIADEIHVHGYDIFDEVAAGGKAKLSFPAEIDGVYEVELEGSGVDIAQLTVK